MEWIFSLFNLLDFPPGTIASDSISSEYMGICTGLYIATWSLFFLSDIRGDECVDEDDGLFWIIVLVAFAIGGLILLCNVYLKINLGILMYLFFLALAVFMGSILDEKVYNSWLKEMVPGIILYLPLIPIAAFIICKNAVWPMIFASAILLYLFMFLLSFFKMRRVVAISLCFVFLLGLSLGNIKINKEYLSWVEAKEQRL